MNRIEVLMNELARSDSDSKPERLIRTNWIDSIEPDELNQLLDGLMAFGVSGSGATDDGELAPLPESVLDSILKSIVRAAKRRGSALRADATRRQLISKIARTYQHFPADFAPRAALLEVLTTAGHPDFLQVFARLCVEDPPCDGPSMDQAFVPLFADRTARANSVFPQILDALQHPGLATAALDLANYRCRKGWSKPHPAAAMSAQLADRLGHIAQHLITLEAPRELAGDQHDEIRDQIAQGVSLGVALCDALAQIGDRQHIGKLYQASEVAHRRLKIEAFAALARLEEEAGIAQLVEMAADPSSRLRAIQYADELGVGDRIDDRFRTDESHAEAELAAWLAEPMQFGLPPTSLKLFDRRALFWPGFNEPVDCFLIQFEYRFGDATYENLGIAGPLTHAFTADLADLPPADIYAAFAGWQATHADIYDVAMAEIDGTLETDRENLEKHAESKGYQEAEWEGMGVFFGERMLIGHAIKNDVRGALAISVMDRAWFPVGTSSRPVSPQLAFCILKGRRFLKTFNPEGSDFDSDTSDSS